MCGSIIYEIIRAAYHYGFQKGQESKQKPRFDYSVGPITLKKGNKMPLDIKLTNEQQVVVHLKPVTPKGNPAKLDGLPTWNVVSGDVTIAVSDDGLSCTIVSPDLAGPAVISVQADADLGEGVTNISDTINVNTVDAEASSLGLTADAPTDKP